MNDRLTPSPNEAMSLGAEQALRLAAGRPDWIGTVRGSELQELVPSDPLLDMLYQGGLDVRSAGVLGKRATDVSLTLGRDARALGDWLDDARLALQAGRTKFRHRVRQPSRKDRIGALGALRRLSDLGLIRQGPFQDQRAEYRNYWPFTMSAERGVRRLVTGEWLTALAAEVVRDQAQRMGVPATVRTLVELEATADLGGWRGELDVLVLAEVGGRRRLLWLECKTGAPQHIKCDRLARQQGALAEVLGRVGWASEVPEVVVVVPPAIRASREDAQGRLWGDLAARHIALVDTHQLRGWVKYVLGGQGGEE